MKNSKNVFLCLLIFTITTSLFAFDFGLNIDTAASSTLRDSGISSQTKISPWLTASFGKQTRMMINGQGSAYLLYNSSTNEFSYILDVELLQFKNRVFALDSLFNYSLGRILEQDATALILNQSIDGVRLNVTNKIGAFSLFAGYTGLLNAHTQDIAVSADDIQETPSSKSPYVLAAPKFVTKISAQLPELIGRNDLYVDIIGEIDFRGLTTSTYTETLHMQYLTLGLSGPIVQNLFYTVFATMELQQTKAKDSPMQFNYAGLFTGQLDYIIPSLDLWLYLKLHYTLFDFKPITNLRPSFLFSNMYDNMFIATIGSSLKFLPFLSGNFAIKTYVQTLEIKDDHTGLQQIEASLGLSYIIMYDAQCTVDAVVASSSSGLKYYLRGKFSLFL